MSERKGDWLQTYTGIHFWPLDPRPEEIDIRDIAHALSLQCRFAGHTSRHYSVAEHSCFVSWMVPPEYRLWGLLHDAAEAYIVDLPRPLKNLPEFWVYRGAENLIMRAVIERFGLSQSEPDEVKRADNILLATEVRDLMGDPRDWAALPEPVSSRIIPWEPKLAEETFFKEFAECAAISGIEASI